LALLLKGIAFSSNVLLVIPQYLLSIMEGIFGLYLLLTFSKKKASVTNKTESIEA
jgi:hypothetical protein